MAAERLPSKFTYVAMFFLAMPSKNRNVESLASLSIFFELVVQCQGVTLVNLSRPFGNASQWELRSSARNEQP